MEGVPTESRRVGYLAQGFSLFPHMTVWQHLVFPIGATPPTAAYWLATLGLEDLTARYPAELSGGQRQRVHWRRLCVVRRICSFSTSPSPPSTHLSVTTCAASSGGSNVT